MAPRKAKDAVPIAPAPAAVDHEDLMRKRDSVSYFSLFASCAFFSPPKCIPKSRRYSFAQWARVMPLTPTNVFIPSHLFGTK
jgi:hypothetical protein